MKDVLCLLMNNILVICSSIYCLLIYLPIWYEIKFIKSKNRFIYLKMAIDRCLYFISSKTAKFTLIFSERPNTMTIFLLKFLLTIYPFLFQPNWTTNSKVMLNKHYQKLANNLSSVIFCIKFVTMRLNRWGWVASEENRVWLNFLLNANKPQRLI